MFIVVPSFILQFDDKASGIGAANRNRGFSGLLRRTIDVVRATERFAPVLIVQLSDMHVSVPGRLFGRRVDSRKLFERAVTRVLSLTPKPDLVILSGDLAETGVAEEYDFIAAQVSRLSCRVIAIPGNHDLREEMLRKLPQCVTAQEGGYLNIVNDEYPLRVIGLDTIVPDKVHGELCAQRLSWLDNILSKENKATLIAMHHPPFKTGMKAMDNYGIKRGLEEFVEIVTRHAKNISAIVCGHAHRMIIANIAGIPVLLSPSVTFPFELNLGDRPALNFVEEPAQFLVHTWHRDAGLVSHAAFVEEFPGPYSVL